MLLGELVGPPEVVVFVGEQPGVPEARVAEGGAGGGAAALVQRQEDAALAAARRGADGGGGQALLHHRAGRGFLLHGGHGGQERLDLTLR